MKVYLACPKVHLARDALFFCLFSDMMRASEKEVLHGSD